MTRRTLRNVHRWWNELWRWVGAGGAWVIHSESSIEYSGFPSTRNSELLDSSPRAGIHLTVDSRSGKRFMGVRGTVTWTLEAEGNQTYASLDAAYQLMGGVFGRALDALLVERAVKKDVDQMLENMKRQLARQTMFT